MCSARSWTFPFRGHLFNRYLLSTYYTPGTVLGSRDTAVNKTGKHPSLQGVGIQYGGGDNEQVDKRATDISVCEND